MTDLTRLVHSYNQILEEKAKEQELRHHFYQHVKHVYEKGYTQERLANLLCVSRQTIIWFIKQAERQN